MTDTDKDPVVITAAARTPIGSFQGQFQTLTAAELGTQAIEAAVVKSNLEKSQISEVIMGCVLSAGQGQAPARQAALGAGLPYSTGCTTINKMCGSGLKAVMMAHDALYAKPHDIFVAGGMESMSNAPYLLPKMRGGLRLGHGEILDHMFLDGLEDAYDKGKLMGCFADETAKHYGFSREIQDNLALMSLSRARQANEDGSFTTEIIPVTVKTKTVDVTFAQDEQPFKAIPEKISKLKPAFSPDGTVTAANSSSISDGAAALVLMRESTANTHQSPVLARLVATATHAQEPAWFTTAPIGAIQKALAQAGWTIADVDLFEINEAFAVVTMAALHDLKLDPEQVNIHGGACALGHPIGASGARILVTLIHALKKRGGKRGIAALCIGGGEAVAVAIELE